MNQPENKDLENQALEEEVEDLERKIDEKKKEI